MKTKIYLLCFSALLMTALSATAQVYKSAEDTVKLNKEYIEVSNEIATLSARLTVAENNMPGYKSKANAADSKAHDAAETSSVQANKATGGGVKEARAARRDSRKALREAKDARSANNEVGDQGDKIASLKGELAKKTERLNQLTEMRDAINAQLTQ